MKMKNKGKEQIEAKKKHLEEIKNTTTSKSPTQIRPLSIG